MRKKIFAVILVGILWFLGGVVSPSFAQTVSSLEEKEFSVFMWCDGDAGDYCDEGAVKTEEFVFEDDDAFYLGTFEDQGIGAGSYNENGILFGAEFETLENLIEHYQFDITGLNIADIVILGKCEVSYGYIIGFGDEKANCYFIGLSK